MTEEAVTAFDRGLQTLSKATEAFVTTLPSLVPSSDINVHTLRNQILAHTLVRMTFIHLNAKFAANDISANARCVEAAIAVVKLFDDVDLVRLEILPPIMAVSAVIPERTNFLNYYQNAWLTAGQVLIQEIARLNNIGAQSPDILPNSARKEEVINLLDRLELMMVTVGAKGPIFSEFSSPALSWLGCLVLTHGRNLGLQHGVLRKSRDEQLVISV